MKDVFDMCIDVRGLVNVPAITGQINGKIYQSIRPSGRKDFKDLVINGLGIDNDQIQSGAGNVNIYVPTITQDGQQVADQAELKKLVALVTPLIDGIYHSSFSTKVDEAGRIHQDEDGSYFANISFSYTSVQENYKHV